MAGDTHEGNSECSEPKEMSLKKRRKLTNTRHLNYPLDFRILVPRNTFPYVWIFLNKKILHKKKPQG